MGVLFYFLFLLESFWDILLSLFSQQPSINLNSECFSKIYRTFLLG